MIVCRKCGYQNGDADGFCGSCGSFLEWTGEKVAPQIPAEVVTAAPEEGQAAPSHPPRHGLLQRAYLAAVNVIPHSDPVQHNPAASVGTQAPPGSPTLDEQVPQAPQAPQTPQSPQSPQAQQTLQAPQTPPPAQHRPQPQRTAPTRKLEPGALICGACGEGNSPARKFCSRCGESLVEAEVVKRPWWKKKARGPKVVQTASRQRNATGQGPDLRLGLRKAFRAARVIIVVLVVVAGLAYGLIPSLRSAVNRRFEHAKQQVITTLHPNYVPVHDVAVAANTQIAGHPGSKAVDEFTNTYWLAPWNPNKEPMLTLTFGHKITLTEMIFHSGVDANFVAYGRPSALHLIFSNGNSQTINPQDTDKPQTLTISGANGITSVEVQIAGVYPGNTGANVAITEIELFALQS